MIERHSEPWSWPPAARAERARSSEDDGKRESTIRPERFARLVTLAGILIETARRGGKLDVRELRETLQMTDAELRQDIDVLNVVNFGGGSYVLYAEVQGDRSRWTPSPTATTSPAPRGCCRWRPRRWWRPST